MNALKIFRMAVPIVVSFGASTVINNAIAATTPANQTIVKKVGAVIGGFVVSSMVGDVASQYVDRRIDEITEQIQSSVKISKI